MNAARLLAHYERISDAPDAIAHLRRFILDLALRGRLVPQEPKDEPASELLVRIEKGKPSDAQKKRPEPSLVTESSAKFPLPDGWAWSTLGAVANVVMGQSPPGDTYNKSGEGVPLLNGPVEFSAGPFGKTIVNQFTTAPTNWCEEGDLLICVRGSTTGRTNVAGFRACIGRGVAAIRPHFDDAFIRLFIWKSRDSIIGMGRGIAFPSVSRKQLEDLAVPIPPLAEQHRIVAKVDELMALCDRLAKARADREVTRDWLATASLARLRAPDLRATAFASHARFAISNIADLTTRPDQIRNLRRTILDLAVRGRLGPQDAKDEPASELLKRIENEKAGAGNDSPRSRPANGSRSIGEVDFSAPLGWVMSTLGALASKITDGTHRTPTYVDVGIPFVSVKDFSGGRLDLSKTRLIAPEEHRLLSRRCDPRRGDILIGRIGTLGRAVLVEIDDEFSLFVSVGLIRFSHLNIVPRFLQMLLNSPFAEAEFDRIKIGGATHTNKLNLGDLKTIAIPLPPLAEQRRIVAKVQELLALCDQLEASLNLGESTRRQLLGALLAEALAPTATQAA